VSAALEYHRATNVAPGGTDEDESREVGAKPPVLRTYEVEAGERLPLESLLAGPVLQNGAGIVRAQAGRDYGGGTMHWRAYSSAGGLFPVEAYVASEDGLYCFDPLDRSFVPRFRGDARSLACFVVGIAPEAEELVILTGIHARTGWKYMERGYRHVWWDAGTMLANLLALAAADGLEPRLYTAFVDRELNDVLGVDGRSEYALAVVSLATSK
jgi:SagB-type dehydrogenase family enzyme